MSFGWVPAAGTFLATEVEQRGEEPDTAVATLVGAVIMTNEAKARA